MRRGGADTDPSSNRARAAHLLNQVADELVVKMSLEAAPMKSLALSQAESSAWGAMGLIPDHEQMRLTRDPAPPLLKLDDPFADRASAPAAFTTAEPPTESPLPTPSAGVLEATLEVAAGVAVALDEAAGRITATGP